MIETTDTPSAPRLLLRPHEAAAALSISERALWTLTATGKLSAVRIGRSKRYDPADLRAWIESQKNHASVQRQETNDET